MIRRNRQPSATRHAPHQEHAIDPHNRWYLVSDNGEEVCVFAVDDDDKTVASRVCRVHSFQNACDAVNRGEYSYLWDHTNV